MKKFIVSVLCAATFFVGLGGLVEGVGAKFKSDERALELLRLARQAVGGDQSIAAVNSLTATGKVTKIFDFDGASKTETGDWEINLQMPDKFSKKFLLRREGGAGGEKVENIEKEVLVVRQSGELKEKIAIPAEGEGGDKKRVAFIVKNDGGERTVTTGDGEKVQDRRVILYKDGKEPHAAGAFHQNELFRTTLALLLTPPQGVDVSYKYAGEGSVDGTSCDIIEATANGSSIRLFLDRSSHLPVMMSYQAPKPFMIRIKKEEGKAAGANEDVKILRENLRDKIPAPEMAEFQVKFSDYRSVNGVQLPFRWTQTVGGKTDEVIEVTAYEVNPANIADKFRAEPTRTFVRTAKPQ